MSLRILAGEYEPTTDELSEILACLSRGEIDIPRGAVGFYGSSKEETLKTKFYRTTVEAW